MAVLGTYRQSTKAKSTAISDIATGYRGASAIIDTATLV